MKGIHSGSRLWIWEPELSYLSITAGAAWRQQGHRCADTERGKMQEGILFMYHFPAVWMAKAALAPVLFYVIIWSRSAQPWNVMYGSSKGPGFFFPFIALTDPGTNLYLTGF